MNHRPDSRAIRFVLKKIQSGFLFESLVQELLSITLGSKFRPHGGTRDQGIDGLEHCLSPREDTRNIYQISIQARSRAKVKSSLQKLVDNSIVFDHFTYITNQAVSDSEKLALDLQKDYGKSVRLCDINWLTNQFLTNDNTLRLYDSFVDIHLHEFASRPDDEYAVMDSVNDPRMYVFLRQQFDSKRGTHNLFELLADSLILFSLKDTDPETSEFMSRGEVSDAIEGILPSTSKQILNIIDSRLEVLSSKPRQINWYRDGDKYVLPYETRKEIRDSNISDRALHDDFFSSVEERLLARLEGADIGVHDLNLLIYNSLRECFKFQGLAFSNFISGESPQANTRASLYSIVTRVVDESRLLINNPDRIVSALFETIRNILYKGTTEETEFLRRLADTYMMLFMLQADPEVARYFASLAGKLRIFVGNSILVPALSEFPLEHRHRRYGNLLKYASTAGVSLYVTAGTIKELAAHIRHVVRSFEDEYSRVTETYTDEMLITTIPELLIRSYFYNVAEGYEYSFHDFINSFATPGGGDMEGELIEYVLDEFGVKYVEEQEWDVNIDKEDLRQLTEELGTTRGSLQAETDAHTVLLVYALREKHNERAGGHAFGFLTWWLSNDVKTQQAANVCFGDRYKPSCYMRPDFLYNYISLAPTVEQTERAFDLLFPNVLGISVSHHLDAGLATTIRMSILDHSQKSPSRVRAIMRQTLDDLKSGKLNKRGENLKLFIDEQLDGEAHLEGPVDELMPPYSA